MQVIGVAEDLMSKMPQDPDAEVKKTKREVIRPLTFVLSSHSHRDEPADFAI